MSISIQQRMALQARKSAASRKVKPQPVTKPSETISVAQRMAQQASVAKPAAPAPQASNAVSMSAAERMAKQAGVAKSDSERVKHTAPPPSAPATTTISAAERIARQVATVSQQSAAVKASAGNQAVVNMYRKQYEEFMKNLDKIVAENGPMFFTAPASAPEAEAKVNGVSTAEGEMVIPAAPAEPVGNLPYQATPVITPAPAKRPPRAPRRKKAVTEVKTEEAPKADTEVKVEA